MRTLRLLLSSRALAVVLLATAVVGALGCQSKMDVAPEVVVSVKAEHPVVATMSEEIAADAILAPLAQAALSPRISSPIRAEYVQRGAHVRQGQLLLTLEDRDLQGAAQDSQGGLTSAEAAYVTATKATIPEEAQKAELDLEQAQALRDVADRTRQERKRLYDQGALSGRDADIAFAAGVQAQAAYDVAVKHLQLVQHTTSAAIAKAAEGLLVSAKGRLVNAEAQVSYATLRSPINGVVTDRPLFPGETAVAGTPILTVMDTSSLLAKLHLAQAAAQKLSLGSKAEIHIRGLDQGIDASVSFISPALDPGSTTVEVWLKLPNTQGQFKVGTPVRVVIHGIAVANATQLPSTALLPSQDGTTSVMVIGAGSIAHRRPVNVGMRTSQKVQILSGVSTADTVITEGAYGLDDGTKVNLGETPAAGEDKGK